jgi:hypothetical protein
VIEQGDDPITAADRQRTPGAEIILDIHQKQAVTRLQ